MFGSKRRYMRQTRDAVRVTSGYKGWTDEMLTRQPAFGPSWADLASGRRRLGFGPTWGQVLGRKGQPAGPPSGWYDDQTDASLVRWWDGATWTEHTHAKA
jgi:hypothetical protein